MLVDLHSHTWYSRDGMMPPKRLLSLAKRKGLNAIAVTDHNKLTPVPSGEVLVVPGEEIKTTAGEVIGLFLTEEVPRGLSPGETFDRILEQGGLIVIPHPFDRFRARTALLLRYRDLPKKDVLIEVKNGRYVLPRFEEEARRFAEERRYPMVGGSDAHTPLEVGRAFTEVPPFSDEEELYEHLRRGRTRPVGGYSSPFVHLTVPIIKALHVLGVIPHEDKEERP